MAGHHPEGTVPWPLVQQSWRRVAFLHWPVEPDAVARLLPPGLIPDVVAGSAWLGVVAFEIHRFRILGLPPLPGLRSFPETNLRTYVRDHNGRDGVWFLSLDVASTLNAIGGRLIGARYHRSTMSVAAEGSTVRYRCRRLTGRAGHDIAVRPEPGDLTGDALATSLAGRWRAFTSVAHRLVEVRVEHQPWPLRPASLVDLHETLRLAAAAALVTQNAPSLVFYADGVDARLGPVGPGVSR
jgi:uncharacterized protein YqjF (DUF2071 family)